MKGQGLEQRHRDFYQALRSRISEWLNHEGSTHRWAKYIMWAPDLFHLLVKLSLDRDVPAAEKAKLAGAIAYFVSPIDLLPELFLGPVGFLDEVVLAAYVLNSLINRSSPEVVKKHWAGDEDILELTQRIIRAADGMLGSGPVEKLRKLFG